jgi:predicted DNA binding CopG/RHH family protein
MRDIRFEWDPAKASANLRKHGVAFAEAETVFSDDLALLVDDPDHSSDEDRFVSARKASTMRKEYDFSQARPNPYARRLKQSVTIRIDEGTIAYFKELAADTGIPYQTLINSYLRDCAASRRRPAMRWVGATKGAA